MTAEQQQMVEFIARRIRKPASSITESTSLVSSGLVDSLALADLLMQLEDLTHTRIPPGMVKPKDMDTVTSMFETAKRVGRPRK